jgi:hypothetical protein
MASDLDSAPVTSETPYVQHDNGSPADPEEP